MIKNVSFKNHFFLLAGVCFFPFFAQIKAQQNLVASDNKQTGLIEIKNGLLGITIPSSALFVKGKAVPAPIQSFTYADGIISDNTLNYLAFGTSVESMKTSFISNTNSKIIVQIQYVFSESSGKDDNKKAGLKPYYTFKVEVNRGEKTIVIEEDATTDISYSVKISRGLNADKARYRGWNSGDIKNGYEQSGNLYRSEDERLSPSDATVDISYLQPYQYQRLVLWEPAGGEQNSGRYWQLFNSKGTENSNIFGFFQGQPSRLINARSVGPNLQIFPTDKQNGEKEDAELVNSIQLRSPDGIVLKRKRFQWIVYISTKKDVLSAEKTQPIAVTMNNVSGLGSVIKSYGAKSAKLIPSFYDGAIYMSAEKVKKLCNAVKNEPGFLNKLLQTDANDALLWNMWYSPEKGKAVLAEMLAYKKQLELDYTTGEGSYTKTIRYWKGSKNFKVAAMLIAGLFADKTIRITEDEKSQLEHFIAMMARILWDDNNVPMFDSAGVNFGPENMVYQYRNDGRYFFALLLKDDPEFSERAKLVAKSVAHDIETAFASNGTSFGSPHYTQAVVEPLLFSMLQLKQSGVADFFKTNKKLLSFARFSLTLLTPPSCRFSGNRKLISFGDGSEEGSATFALLATGLLDVDPALSKQLMAAFNYGPPQSSTHGTIKMAFDATASTERKIYTSTANYNGYVTHYRYGINMPDETAIWMLNGETFRDHRNDDAGETAIYALGAPLSLSRSSFYYPFAPDARIRSVVVPEAMFPEWNKDEQPIAARSMTNRTWPSSTVLEFGSLGYSNSTRVFMKGNNGAEWYRQLTTIGMPGDNPIIIYYDSVKGGNPSIWNMMMMSVGPIGTPVGNIEPEQRINNFSTLKQLPKGTPTKSIAPGLNRFAFTGQQWIKHPTGGINWYLYTLSESSIDFSLADWATTWQNDIEKTEFMATNQRSYLEEQQIVRLRSSKPFFTVLLPFNKGDDKYRNGVERVDNNAFRIKLKDKELVVGKGGYFISQQNHFVMASWTLNGMIENRGYTISGGYTEIERNSDTFFVRIHGKAGSRKITLPFSVKSINSPKETNVKINSNGNVVMIEYAGSSLDLANGENAYKEYTFLVQQ